MNRNLINAGLALLLVPFTVFLVLKKFPEPAKGVLTFQKPTHRVAVAVDEVLRRELASVVPGDFEMNLDYLAMNPNGKPPLKPAETPKDDSAFWFPVQGIPGPVTSGQSLMTLDQMEFTGKTRGGREVHVTISTDTIGEGSLVDFHGDEALAHALSSRIADRLDHPRNKHDSPEDRAALVAFFRGPGTTKMPVVNGQLVAPLDPAVKKASATDEADPEDGDK